MNKKTQGFRIYFALIMALLIFAVLISFTQKDRTYYTKSQLAQDIKDGQVSEVVLHPNPGNGTGTVEVSFKAGGKKNLYVTDLEDMEKILEETDVELYVEDIPRDSWFLSYVLPILIVLIVGVFLFVIMTAQSNASAGQNSRMMNFGKSRARIYQGDSNKITLKDVAGLKEEKNELEEIVEFLKDPGKFI
ncbi:MAG: ATP-dependent metallopeptidase FtsH/Yme1/Tma family protein, partial [Lachnospiraceae bacterium]|nr:ATP-dependent metallopeptidase FtsH/Yme1/Tma family protein [Lachnospiraceae bacterium]